MLVVLLKKKTTDYNTKIKEIKNKLNHNRDKYITTQEFITLAADVFNVRLTPANLVTKAEFDAKLSSNKKKVNVNKTKHLLKINWKNWKHLIWVILLARLILKKMAHKIISYVSH